MEVKFYEQVPDHQLKFAVIIAKAHGKWVFCRHRQRIPTNCQVDTGRRKKASWTLPHGNSRRKQGRWIFLWFRSAHTPLLEKIRSIPAGKKPLEGFYAADIIAFEPELHREIEQVLFLDELPRDLKPWTYPMIQPKLVEEAKRRNLV